VVAAARIIYLALKRLQTQLGSHIVPIIHRTFWMYGW
jgi:hypothetical protein